jgi:uronate dehydrogenase
VNRPVLLTGASGRIGRVLAVTLAGEGWTVRLTDRLPFPDPLPPRATFEAVDLTDRPALSRMAKGCAAILHFGGIPNDNLPVEVIATANLLGVHTVYEAARMAGARVIFASSNHCVGFHERPMPGAPRLDADAPTRPDGLYGLSKVYGEGMGRLYWDKHGVESVNVRIGSCCPAPVDVRMLSTWISPADLARLCVCALVAPRTGWAVVWGASANSASFWGADDRDRIGWQPCDSADAWRDVVGAIRADDPVAERFQGGAFAARGYDRPALADMPSDLGTTP